MSNQWWIQDFSKGLMLLDLESEEVIRGGSGISHRGWKPRRGGRQLNINLAKMYREMHKYEEKWTKRSGVGLKFYYVDPPLPISCE